MPDPDGTVDDSATRNLDTQHRRLTQIERDLDTLLAGEPLDVSPAFPDRPETYAQLTITNDTLREQHGWHAIDLDAALSPEALAEFELWRQRRRTPWQLDDILAVAFAGAVGIAATWFDTTIDNSVRDRLEALSETPLIKRWEKDAKRLPIDHMGPGFGGKLHRVRSAGHDIGRPFEALRQIREGQFHGYIWDNGERIEVYRDNYRGHRYQPVESQAEAIALWSKHMLADFVTETNLPLPGWTWLQQCDNRQLRQFANDAYANGANLRAVTVGTLPVLTTEITIRTHVHGRAMASRGTAVLPFGESALCTELLLAGHSFVGAASLGKAITTQIAASSALAFRHINWPVLMTAALTALHVARDARARHATADSWDDLLGELAYPWQLDEAAATDRAFSD